MKKIRVNWNQKHNRPTVGAIVEEAQTMESPSTDARELQQGMASNKMEPIFTALERGLKMFSANIIYVVLIRIFDKPSKTIRNKYMPTTICPTPTFNQAVFRYDRTDGKFELLWTLPGMEICNYFLRNEQHLDKQQKELLKFVHDFKNGSLDRMQYECNKLGVR